MAARRLRCSINQTCQGSVIGSSTLVPTKSKKEGKESMYDDYDPYDPQRSLDVDLTLDVVGNDDAVVAKATINFFGGEDYVSVTESSKRDAGDPVNHEIGTKLAIGRALRQLGRELLRDAQEGVREQARVKKAQEEAAAAAREKKEKRKAEVKILLKEPRCAANPQILKRHCSLCRD